ncbi:WD40/YVTN/BNR-like repeat-containing protein [Streptomyces sp. INA 01156]
MPSPIRGPVTCTAWASTRPTAPFTPPVTTASSACTAVPRPGWPTATRTPWASPSPARRRSWPAATPPRPMLRPAPHLGLIRSTDAGRTWQTLSVEGEADFHSLVQAGDVLYGFDSLSGRVWASTDGGRSWYRRARVAALDLASHSGSASTVWAATGTGLERSTDGGRTFRSVSSAPGLVAVEEPEPGSLVALAADGRVLTARGGGPWAQLGRLPEGGQAAVLTAVTAQRLLAADSTDTVYESADGGRTWMLLHRPATGPEPRGLIPPRI